MPDERHAFESLPIPTYDEATASTPYTSSPLLDTRHRHNTTTEHHGLLGRSTNGSQRQSQRHGSSRRSNYQAPAVESGRSSYDSNYTTPELSSQDEDDDDNDDSLRRDMEEMEFVDIAAERRAPQRTRLRISKTFSNLRATLSSIHIPFSRSNIPSFNFLYSRLPAVPASFKVPWSIVFRLVGLFILVSFVYSLMVFRILGSGRNMMASEWFSQRAHAFVHDNILAESIEKYLKDITFDDHIAGTDGGFYTASRIEHHFQESTLDAVFRDNFEVYLNYPKSHGRRVDITFPAELKWRAKLEEDVLRENSDKHQSAVFHAHAKSGEANGPLIYANFGSREDFAYLKENGINVTGSIVLVRQYGSQSDPASKVKAAELAGAVGCLIYSDPGEDGALKGRPYPHGRWRPSDSVQRGSVSLTSFIVGDVLTPGNASTFDAPRISTKNNPALPQIPSLPLSWRDAEVMLKALRGCGMEATDGWKGGSTEIEWWTGDTTSSPQVNLKNLLDENVKQPIRNILGKIDGFEEPEKVVYIGNHRDATCFGAVQPGSGTAVLMEIVRVFGLLSGAGWRPRRSIVFASWDAGEYNLIGSTEHVESRIEQMRRHGVAYVNIGAAVSGEQLWANGSPIFRQPLLMALDRVAMPQQNLTLRQQWMQSKSQLGGLAGDGDYVAFQDLAGCSSIDIGFKGPDHGFPFQSCYDSFEWMKTVGDPEFEYHRTLAEVLALLILEIADDDFLPFDVMHYATSLQTYVETLKMDVSALSAREDPLGEQPGRLNVQPLEEAVDIVLQSAQAYGKSRDMLMSSIRPQMMENPAQSVMRINSNRRLMDFEANLLDLPSPNEDRPGGVPGRHQYKHVVFAPQAWAAHNVSYFPAIRDALENGDWTAAQEQLEIVALILKRAATSLVL